MNSLARIIATLTAVILCAVAAHAQFEEPDASKAPNPASEAAVRRMIGDAQSGAINYDLMTEQFAALVRPNAAAYRQMFTDLGAVEAVDFVGVAADGDVFDVSFANGDQMWTVELTPDGKTSNVILGRFVDAR